MEWYSYDIRSLSAADYAHYYALMTPEKRRRTDHFRFEDDRKRTVTADMLARRIVADWCGINEKDIVFDLGPYLKPFARGLNVEFSVSHSHNLAVCAVDEVPIGIDIEKLCPIDLRIARRVCTAAELEYLFGRAPEELDFTFTKDLILLERFFQLWTRKEAFGKWSGEGLAQLEQPLPTEGFQTFRRGDYVISIYR